MMRNGDIDLIALLTKGLHDLRARLDRLAREPGPEGLAVRAAVSAELTAIFQIQTKVDAAL